MDLERGVLIVNNCNIANRRFFVKALLGEISRSAIAVVAYGCYWPGWAFFYAMKFFSTFAAGRVKGKEGA